MKPGGIEVPGHRMSMYRDYTEGLMGVRVYTCECGWKVAARPEYFPGLPAVQIENAALTRALEHWAEQALKEAQ